MPPVPPHSFLLSLFLALLALALLGGALWFFTRRKKRRPALAPFELGAAGAWLKAYPEILPQQIEIEKEKIHFIQIGKGPDVVLLHGIGASLFIWRFTILQLAKNHRVTALDLPGFGRSTKLDRGDYGLDAQRRRLTKFMDALNIRRADLVGSSMGGALALWLAHEDPKRYPKVAALAPATSPEIIPRRLSQAVARAPLTHKALNRFTMKMILSYVLTKRDLITPETIEAYLEPYLDEGLSVRTFLAALQLLGDRRMPQCFAGLESDVLLVQGARDRLVTMSSIRRLAKILPSAKLAVSSTGGHHIMEDEPEWTTAQLLRFLGEAPN